MAADDELSQIVRRRLQSLLAEIPPRRAAGDRALVEFAGALTAATPYGGIAARIGGEEFALFLPKAATDEAAELADSIRRVTADLRVVTNAGVVSLTVSCGVAGVSEVGPDFQNLHAAADRRSHRPLRLWRNLCGHPRA